MKSSFIFVALVLACCLTVSSAELKKADGDKSAKWIMENDKVQIEIDPVRGGRVSQFRDKAFAEPAIKEHTQGLFVDHLAQQDWPGELWEKPYEAKVISSSGTEVALELSTVFEGKWKDTLQPKAKGVLIKKTYRLADGECGLRVEHRLENPTGEAKQFSLWMQNIQQLGTYPKNNMAVRSAKAGVYRFKMMEQAMGESWKRYKDSLDASFTVLDPVSGQALSYFQDWDYLDGHYCAGPAFTIEWFMMPASIPPGKFWTTASQVISRKVSPDLCAVSPELWAGASLNDEENAIRVTIGGDAAVKSPEMKGVVRYRSATADRFERLSLEYPVKFTLKAGENLISLPKGCVPPVFLTADITVSGKTLSVNEFLGGGKYPRNEPLPGYPPIWDVQVPDKNPQLIRPKELKFEDAASAKALLANGMMCLQMNVTPALEACGMKVEKAYPVSDTKESGLNGFPGSYEEALSRRLIVMDNIDFRLLGTPQRRMLLDYLEAGGGMIIFGGTETTLKSTEKNPFFPGAVKPASDSVNTGVGIRKSVSSKIIDASLFPESGTCVFWSGPDKSAVASVEGKPVISVIEAGKGRIVYCGLSVMGETVPSDYWQSKQWTALVKKMAEMALGL